MDQIDLMQFNNSMLRRSIGHLRKLFRDAKCIYNKSKYYIPS